MNNTVIKKNRMNNKLFLAAFIIFLFFTILNSSFYAKYIPSLFYKATFIIEILILLLKEIITKKMGIREWIGLIIIILLTFVVYTNLSGQFPVLLLFLFIYSARNVSLEKIIDVAFFESIFLLIFIVLSSKIGIIPNYIEYGSRVREFLGFRYSLYAPALLFNIISLDLYRKRNNKKLVRNVIWCIISYIFFRYTCSRLSFYLSILLIFFSTFLSNNKKNKRKNRLIGFFCCISYILCFVFSIYITYNFNPSNKNYYVLNDFLGNRLYYGNKAIQEYGINLFGHDIELVGNGLDMNGLKNNNTYNYVDCLYVILLLRYGIVFVFIFIIALTYTNIYLYRKKEYFILLVMVLYAFHGIIDDLMIYLYYNTFWLVVGKMILNNKYNVERSAMDVEKISC